MCVQNGSFVCVTISYPVCLSVCLSIQKYWKHFKQVMYLSSLQTSYVHNANNQHVLLGHFCTDTGQGSSSLSYIWFVGSTPIKFTYIAYVNNLILFALQIGNKLFPSDHSICSKPAWLSICWSSLWDHNHWSSIVHILLRVIELYAFNNEVTVRDLGHSSTEVHTQGCGWLHKGGSLPWTLYSHRVTGSQGQSSISTSQQFG